MARNLTAQIRTETGKNCNNRLRVQGMIPVVMYSHGKSELLQVNKREFGSVFAKRISESVIVDLDVAGKEKCHIFVKDYQSDPVTDEVIHLDFYKITAGEKIKTTVPVEYKGTPIGVRAAGGEVFRLRRGDRVPPRKEARRPLRHRAAHRRVDVRSGRQSVGR